MEPVMRLVKGGRYDHLIGQFGKDAASVGFAVVLDELMLALSRQKIDIPTNEEAAMVFYEPEYRNSYPHCQCTEKY